MSTKTGPFAIVGIGCRFPGGAGSPAAFWRMLCSGVDAIREMPADRFALDRLFDRDPSQPGRIYTRDQLMDSMYRDERVVSDRTVDSHIKKIRKKISTVLPDREIVHSVYGVGYKYEW